MFVTREGDFQRTGLESVDEAEVFKGSENIITLIQTHSKKFHCTYLLHDFPFDTQVEKGEIIVKLKVSFELEGLLCSYDSQRIRQG